MTYKETVEYLYSRLPLFSRIGKSAYKEDITNTVRLCNSIGNPQLKTKFIHIAGTNGKGSTSHMLAAILQKVGYKTGLYTSPHLKDFRERIKINGQFISEEFIIEFVESTKAVAEEIEPSFFELTVAMALQYFADQKVDIAVIETGLGGRLDSTNIITPLISIITNIGYDHQNILGDTLPLIASEKAGIIKENVPVIIGEVLDETRDVFLEKSKASNAPIIFSQELFETVRTTYRPFSLQLELKAKNKDQVDTFELDLNGLYQEKNLKTVLSAVALLNQQDFQLSLDSVKEALADVKGITGLRGRWDVIQKDPLLILDVAHNEDGLNQVIHQLSMIEYRQLHLVIGMVKDKDASKVLSILPENAIYYFTHAHIPRALPAVELKEKAAAFMLRGEAFEDVNKAIAAARLNAAIDDLILVCGSVFVIGEVNFE